MMESGFTELFTIITGIQQGCILSPLLFLFMADLDFVLKKVMSKPAQGVPWKDQTRLNFADDIALQQKQEMAYKN